MKKTTFSIVLWIITGVLVVGLFYEYDTQKRMHTNAKQLIAKANREVQSLFAQYENDKNTIGYAKVFWQDKKSDTLQTFHLLESVYENSHTLRERIDAFRQEMIQPAPAAKQLFLSKESQSLLQDSLQTYHYNMLTKECRECQLGRDAYSDSELDLWALDKTLPLVWNTALLTLEAKTWILQHRTIEFHTKKYMTMDMKQFPFTTGKIYVDPEFRVVEEGKLYSAKLFFGMSAPTLRNYLSMKTDFQKVQVNKKGEGRVVFTTWTNSFDETGEFHKTWEGDVYLVNNFLLLNTMLSFKDTTFKVEDDYMLLKELY